MADSPIFVDDDSPPPTPLSYPARNVAQKQQPSLPQTPARKIFVSPPPLATDKKRQYKPADKSSLRLGLDTRVDEVIGEYLDGNTLFYYARYAGGIANKYQASSFSSKYPGLVDTYKEKKIAGTLAPFDPSAKYIHPLSRPEVVPDSQEEYTEDDDDDEEEEDDEDGDYGKKRRTQPKRATHANPRDLPFSPRKTRSRKVLQVQDSESSLSDIDLESRASPRPTRRSTRARKTTEIQLDSDAEYVESQSDAPLRKIKILGPRKRNPSRPKSIMPMYGRVRDIKALDEDAFSDDEANEVLRRHRQICEKCHDNPANKLLATFKKRKNKGKKRKRGSDDDLEYSDEEERFTKMGGWVLCLKCPVAAHWGCLATTQQEEVLKAIREKDREELERQQPHGAEPVVPRKRAGLEVEQITEFVCGACMRGGICLGCMETALEGDPSRKTEVAKLPPTDQDVVMADGTAATGQLQQAGERGIARELLFRCFTCKRLAHYRHLPRPTGFEDDSIADIAEHYQNSKSWLCADCASYKYGLDKIIAWRPYPPNSVEPARDPRELANYKSQLPREYLVKWVQRSYRRLNWVPHMWLLSTNPSKLKNFISGGTKVELLEEPISEDLDVMNVDGSTALPSFEKATESRSPSTKPEMAAVVPSSAMPDAERRIPLPWKTVHRVLDVVLWRPRVKKGAPKQKRKVKKTISSSEEEEEEIVEEKRLAFEAGEQPSADFTRTVKEWEEERSLGKDDIDHVVWAFIKWDELGYEEASWDSPPRRGEPGYDAFKAAYDKFIESRSVLIPNRDKSYWKTFDNRAKDVYMKKHMLKKAEDLDLGQAKGLKLMPFQVDGFNWLCNNWWNNQHCILADEMGLGKTVQIASFLGNINAGFNAFPALVVVPNSTITNWIREFERWTPHLRAVPFYGEKNARDVIKQFELFHDEVPKGNLKTKFHVLVTTYESLTNPKDFNVIFKNQPRWEVLVIDEGQRLKNDNSLLFKKLNELNTRHRIIMTGTPLNNNMRELFNLMNFLDPEEWRDLEALEKQHEELTEELVKDLHNRLRPYFLRRIKSEVLELPPKNEVIVPVSMAPVQREVYRSILSNNLDILKGLTQPSAKPTAPAKTRINNVLMQLRKCLQHPYLYAEDIEPRNLSPSETHGKLIDASAKLRFLKMLLPKLKERGHRVLLFSQFVIALNVIEDFLAGEGYKFLRLDGNTKGSVRQKSMDEFNKPNSDYFIFLLTTRAGGVGINLFTADTVIIFDPDFNPHQDLQAIARAYRYGQKKTCLVFKLMVKESAEERIMQVGKKKLVLDHLIVQKINDDEENGGEDVKSILTYGAQALFESDPSSRDITYTEQDVERLIEKTQKEAVPEGPKAGGGLSFSFAKVWAADKDDLQEVVEDDQTDSWAQALEKLNEEREREQQRQLVESGRGARRKAADIAKTKIHVTADGSTNFEGKKTHSPVGSVYGGSDIEMDNGEDMIDDDFVAAVKKAKNKHNNPLHAIQNTSAVPTRDCGLCGERHHLGYCPMAERSENLAEYREMLILHADDEPWEERNAAIEDIDATLMARGDIALIVGQPLRALPKPLPDPPAPKKLKTPNASHGGGAATSSKQAVAAKDQQKVKKSNPYPPSPCLLCHKAEPHHLKDCDVVRAGSKSISKAIQHLESRNDIGLISSINTLRTLLAKAKAREMARELSGNINAVAGPSSGTPS